MATLAERTGPPGPPPGPDATRLVRRVHELFAVPLEALTAEDLRLLLRQGIAADILLPHAVAVLDADPWTGGDMSDGALLAAVLAVPDTSWPVGCADRLAVRLAAPDAQEVLAGPPPEWWQPEHDHRLSSQTAAYPRDGDDGRRSSPAGRDGGDRPDVGDDVRAAAGAFLAARSSQRP